MSVITVTSSEKAAYLSLFLNDDDVTVPNTSAIHHHVENPIGKGKNDDHDAHDDELQMFSK